MKARDLHVNKDRKPREHKPRPPAFPRQDLKVGTITPDQFLSGEAYWSYKNRPVRHAHLNKIMKPIPENDHATLIVNKVLEADQPPAQPEQDKGVDFWDRYDASVKNIQGMAKQSRSKLDDMSKHMRVNPTKYGDKSATINAHISNLDSMYIERDKLLAKMRYAAAYRRACAKAGVKLGEVVGRNSTWSKRPPLRGNLDARYITQVVLRDGTRVEIDPVEIPR